METDPDKFIEILGKGGIPDPRSFIVDKSGMSINSTDVGEMFSNKIEIEGVLKNKINVSEYRKISGGSVRDVYQISNDKVVKVAKHPRGLEQNYLATDSFLMNNEHWPEVFETGKDYVVAEYVPRNDKVANQYLKPLKKFTAQDWNNKLPELQKAMEEMGLDDFLNYNLLWNDFKSVRNWGVRKDGTVVLIDEGAISDQITATSKIDNFTKQEWEDVKQARRNVLVTAALPTAALTEPEQQTTEDFIKSFEGYRDEGYYATEEEKEAGIVTAGYGSTRRVAKGEKITEEQAEQYLNEDIAVAEKAIDSLVKVDLTPNQKAAIVSLIFNVGQGNFKKSKALKALNKGDIDTFLKEAFDPKIGFVKSGGKVLNGLVTRRQAEKQLFLGGTA
jgi:lysozyme